ncbi:DUF4232 domain-containing protein [Streptomyces hyaluromycini]|uniref:DUF4232 domain-containing protein n=1 Tax=Streptomyces hyaluromycini TaxID=1377993 RepID=UPI000B5CA228|nr:DUF4232 domain-containing protein [Streptomyces hyaluromycini]
MAHTSQSLRRGAALLASTVAALGLLTACGNGGQGKSPESVSGTAAPATGNASSADTSGTSAVPSGTGSSPASQTGGSATGGGSSTGGTTTGTTAAAGTRCHTSELTASVGGNDPGAGQENFPIVLTNKSGRTCTVRGYPGAAFVNAAGTQLGPDPQRESGSTAATVTLKPGQSAWAGLTFSSPEISGAKTATPAALLVTPPDEKDSLKVAWTNGAVPVSGNASSVRLNVFSAGTGA